MNKINASSSFGNFDYSVEISLVEELSALAEKLAVAGLIQIAQRSPASKVEKALAGYEKRPAKFDRGSVEFSIENAEKFSSIMSVELAEELELAEDEISVSVTEHVKNETKVQSKGIAELRAAYGFVLGGLMTREMYDKVAEKCSALSEDAHQLVAEYSEKLASME